MDKAALRKQFLELRQSMSQSVYWKLMDGITDQLNQIRWKRFNMVHLFLPISRHKEIDTFSILSYFKQEHPEIEIVIPRTDFVGGTMIQVLYDHTYTILRRNQYGIPEPVHGKIVEAKQVDFVFIPLLAFDKQGQRAGYGKGFYDRFLAECRPDVVKVGLSFFDPVDRISDINEFDVTLDACVTPEKIWLFKAGLSSLLH